MHAAAAKRRRLCFEKSLLATHPEVAATWDAEKNADLTPDMFTHGSHKTVFWLCRAASCGCLHSWKAMISNRTNGKGCPYCVRTGLHARACHHESLAGKHTHLMNEWDFAKNVGIDPTALRPMSSQKVWWICSNTNCEEQCPHSYEATLAHRTFDKSGCPFCSQPPKRVCEHNSLQRKCPDLMKEWDPSNSKSPLELHVSSNHKVLWKCQKCSHGWWTAVNNRTGKYATGCPECNKSTSEAEKKMLETLDRLSSEPNLLLGPRQRNARLSDQHRLEADIVVTLPLEHGEQTIVIELDGGQHFKSVASWGGEQGFACRQDRDRRKNRLCEEKHCHLLRVSHDVPTDRYEGILKAFFDRIKTHPERWHKEFVGKAYETTQTSV